MRLEDLTGPGLAPRAGFHYEPRALWSKMLRERTTLEDATVTENFVPYGREDFYNASRFPIVITHMVVLSKPLESASPFGCVEDFSQPEIQKPTIRISKQGSLPFSIQQQIGAIGFEGNTNSGPQALSSTNGQPPKSFLDGFNMVRWDLELPLTIPDRGQVQFDVSGHAPLFERIAIPGPARLVRPLDVRGTTQFFEIATGPQLTPGNSRTHVATMRVMSERDARAFTSSAAVDQVIALANSELGVADPYAGSATSTWDNGYGMPARVFIGKQASVNRAATINSMQLAFAKLDADERINFMPDETGIPPVPRAFIARQNLTQSLYCRAKVSQGGSNTWWWREGAPLALVMPSITPAPVYRFPKPFLLGPGEGLDIKGSLPTDGLYPRSVASPLGTPRVYESHGFYVSVCGYACLKH